MPCSTWQLNELAVAIGGGKVVTIISVVIGVADVDDVNVGDVDVGVDVGDVDDSKL